MGHEPMSGRARTIVTHTAIYTVGTVLRNIASIVMLPIYTRYLDPSDYGVIELLSSTIELFSVLFGLRIGEAIFRYHAAYESRQDKNEVITTALFLVAALTCTGLLILFLFAEALSLIIFGSVAYIDAIRLFGITLPLSALSEVAFLYLRAEQRPWTFVGFSTIRLVLQLSLNIYLVVIEKMRVEGVIYSAVVSNSIMTLVLLASTFRRAGLGFSWVKARELATFSWPLIFTALAMSVSTTADRYFLQHFGDSAQVGLYSLGYKFGYMLLVFIWSPFSSTWDSERYAVLKSTDPQGLFNKIFVLISFLMIFSVLGIAVFAEDVLRVMSDPQFWSAHQVVPIILLAYLLQAWTMFTSVGLLLHGKTVHALYATLVSTAFVMCAYVILIPRLGALGAAVGTLLGFTIRFSWVYLVSKRCYDMGLRWAKVIKMGVLALSIYALSRLAPQEWVWSVTVHVALMVLFLVSLLVLPILSSDERGQIVAMIRNPRNIRNLFLSTKG